MIAQTGQGKNPAIGGSRRQKKIRALHTSRVCLVSHLYKRGQTESIGVQKSIGAGSEHNGFGAAVVYMCRFCLADFERNFGAFAFFDALEPGEGEEEEGEKKKFLYGWWFLFL